MWPASPHLGHQLLRSAGPSSSRPVRVPAPPATEQQFPRSADGQGQSLHSQASRSCPIHWLRPAGPYLKHRHCPRGLVALKVPDYADLITARAEEKQLPEFQSQPWPPLPPKPRVVSPSQPEHGMAILTEGQGGDGTVVCSQYSQTGAVLQRPYTDRGVHGRGEEQQPSGVWMEGHQTEEKQRQISCTSKGDTELYPPLLRYPTHCTTPGEPRRWCVP